jgi:hypothetical protein
VSLYSLSSWGRASEFHCQECGHHEAYRSRPRGVFEKYLLPILMLRPVRCDRCYRRSYARRTVAAALRMPSAGRHTVSQSSGISAGQSRIA